MSGDKVFSPTNTYYECGCCGGYHARELPGSVDCRADEHRFTYEELDAHHQALGNRTWEEITLQEQMESEERDSTRKPAIYRDGVCYRRVDELQPGDRVDLEGDLYADSENYAGALQPDPELKRTDHPEFEFEYEVVMAIDEETADCFRVDFESGFSCGFPPDHEVEVDGEQ